MYMSKDMVFRLNSGYGVPEFLASSVAPAREIAFAGGRSVSHEHVSVHGNTVPDRVHLPARFHERPIKKLGRIRRKIQLNAFNHDIFVLEVLPVRDRESRTGSFVLVVETPVVVPSADEFVSVWVVSEARVELFNFLQATVNRDVAGNDENIAVRPVPIVPMPVEV